MRELLPSRLRWETPSTACENSFHRLRAVPLPRGGRSGCAFSNVNTFPKELSFSRRERYIITNESTFWRKSIVISPKKLPHRGRGACRPLCGIAGKRNAEGLSAELTEGVRSCPKTHPYFAKKDSFPNTRKRVSLKRRGFAQYAMTMPPSLAYIEESAEVGVRMISPMAGHFSRIMSRT